MPREIQRGWASKGASSSKISSKSCGNEASSSSGAKQRPVVKGVIDLSGGSVPKAQHTGCKPVVKDADEDRLEALGKLMAKILRHQAEDMGLKIREDGFCGVGALLKLDLKTRAGHSLRSHTPQDVLKVVEKDSKNRFSTIEEGGRLLVRANQGHSMKVVSAEKLLKIVLSAEEVPVCVHGTYFFNLKSILKTGLRPMSRNHVHFATGLPDQGGVISGMRASSEVLIYLNVAKAMEDGMKLYRSENDVILTEGLQGAVSPKYFLKIVKWPSCENISF